MKQIESKAGFAPSQSLGPGKIRAANQAMHGARKEGKRKAKASQNAYRAAIGLPPK